MGGKNSLKNSPFYQVIKGQKSRFASLEKSLFISIKKSSKEEGKEAWKRILSRWKPMIVTG